MGGGQSCGGCAGGEAKGDAPGDEQPLQVGDDRAIGGPAGGEGEKWVLAPGQKLCVMLFGMTGAGKSSLGNLIAGFDAFESGDDTASVTNLDSVMRYEAEDSSLVLLDTVGLGDTEIDQTKVVQSIGDVALSAPGGIDVLLFVMRNQRITDDAISRLVFVTEYLWGSDCLLNLYVVVTCASRYMNSKEEAKKWIDRQVEINWRFKHIYRIVGNNPNRFIFVDNPDKKSGEPDVVNRQAESKNAVMRTLCLHPQAAVPPFTFKAMKTAEELTKMERQVLEERRTRLQEQKKKLKQHQKGKKESRGQGGRKNSAVDAELEAAIAAAKREQLAAEKAMRQALAKARSDHRFQTEAAKEVEQASVSFSRRYCKQDSSVSEGDDKGGQLSSEKVNFMAACRRIATSLLGGKLPPKAHKPAAKGGAKSSSARGSHSGSKRSTPLGSRQATPQHSPTKSPPPEEDDGHRGPLLVEGGGGAERLDRAMQELVAQVRTAMQLTPEETFKRLDTSRSGAITPMDFSGFLTRSKPGIRRQQVGGLWRLADANCDGQVDLQEFCNLLSGTMA